MQQLCLSKVDLAKAGADLFQVTTDGDPTCRGTDIDKESQTTLVGTDISSLGIRHH